MRMTPAVGRAVGLRPTLVSVIVGLVLLTAATIGGGAAILTVASTRALVGQARTSAVTTASEEVRQFFDLGPRITEELAAEARRGVLPLDRPERLVAQFIERLRVQPHLSWIGYGEVASGRYIGATRWENGELVEYIADPQVNGGLPAQTAVADDGTRSTPKYVETAPYFVVKRPWFQQGIAEPGPTWSPVYQMTTGGLGITAMTRYTAPGAAAPTGLFHVDLRLEGIGAFLSTLRIGEHGAVFLVDRQGHRIASPSGEHVAAAAAAADRAAQLKVLATAEAPAKVKTRDGHYEVVFAPVEVSGNLGAAIAVVVDRGDITSGLYRQAVIAVAAALAGGVLAIVLGIVLSSRISRPVTAIAEDLMQVGEFKISQAPSPQSFVREISELGVSVDHMKASLRSFGHYVPSDVVRALLAEGREAQLGGEIRRLTMHFSDVADFTTISEGMAPRQLVEAMGRYFELMTATIARHGGTVDKFMGDGIMAFFNAPTELPDHPRHACIAALEAQEALARLARERPPGMPLFRARIGLGLGDVLVGNIGTPERFAYTLLGDEVNLASRLEGLNKVYGTAIMGTDALAVAAGESLEWRRLDRVAVKGRHQGTLVCELIGRRGEVEPARLAARDLYEKALAAYLDGRFQPAADMFEAAARAWTRDLAAPTMGARARELAAAPPQDWNGIHVMHEK